MIDITTIVVLVILLLFALIGTFLIPLIKANTSAKDREQILFWTKIAVKAADQLTKTGVIQREERQQHVIDFLSARGITVDMSVIKEVLEACVSELPPLVTDDEKKEIQENTGSI